MKLSVHEKWGRGGIVAAEVALSWDHLASGHGGFVTGPPEVESSHPIQAEASSRV